MTTHQQFTLRKDGFKEIRKAMLLRMIPIFSALFFFVYMVNFYPYRNQPGSMDTMVYLVPLLLGAVGFGVYTGVARQKKIFESYVLTFDGSALTRTQYNTPDVVLNYDTIRAILKNKNGSITVKGDSAVNVIGIPAQMEAFEALEKLLNEIKPVTSTPAKSLFQVVYGLLPFVTLALMAVIIFATNKIIVALSGTALLGLLGYSVFEIMRSKNIDRKTRNSMWLMIFVVFSILTTLYFKLFYL